MERKRVLTEMHKGFVLRDFRRLIKDPEQLKVAIDQALIKNPEYLGDKANMFRILAYQKGSGKQHLSALKDGAELHTSFKISRRRALRHNKIKLH